MTIKKILCITAALFLSQNIFAQEKQYFVCDKNVNALSNQFASAWEWNATRHNYFSYVAHDSLGQRFTGALHTLGSNMPMDQNPHLQYSHLDLQNVKHYGLWSLDCNYTIRNAHMSDESDGYLHMTNQVSTAEYKCNKTSDSSVECVKR